MPRHHLTTGLLVAIVAAASFGVSGPFVKPLLESGWSPVAAVTVRALVGGVLLAPIAVVALRGDLRPVWRARRRVLGMAVVGVSGTQVFYFAAIERIPVGTAILLEYMAPLLLVAVAWLVTRRRPSWLVLVGSVVAAVGLVLVVAPAGGVRLDPVGVAFGVGAMACVAGYFVLAARPADGLPPIALAAAGLLVGGVLLGLFGLTGLVPFTASTVDVTVLGVTHTVVGADADRRRRRHRPRLRHRHHVGRDAGVATRLLHGAARGRGRGAVRLAAARRAARRAPAAGRRADPRRHRRGAVGPRRGGRAGAGGCRVPACRCLCLVPVPVPAAEVEPVPVRAVENPVPAAANPVADDEPRPTRVRLPHRGSTG